MADTEKKRHFFETHILDLYKRACHSGYPVFTDFLTTGEQASVMGMNRQFHKISTDIDIRLWGGHFDCDRIMAGFIQPEYNEYWQELFPIRCICAEPTDTRYCNSLSHRDYLGAVLNLGIQRSVIGDIRLSLQKAYIFCREDISSFIQEQLTMVKNTSVSCTLIDNPENIPKQEYDIFTRSIASPRLDNVVSAMIGKARGQAVELISQGKVIVNSSEQLSVSYTCRDGCVISIRGYGKFRLTIPELAISKKGKQKIEIFKYK